MPLSLYDIFADLATNIQEEYNVLNKVGGHVGLKVPKTWLNGWASSHRMHEEHMLNFLAVEVSQIA